MIELLCKKAETTFEKSEERVDGPVMSPQSDRVLVVSLCESRVCSLEGNDKGKEGIDDPL